MVLEALGKKLNYESISNIYGNSFAKDAGKLVQRAYPLAKNNSNVSNVSSMIGMTQFKTVEASGESGQKALGKALGGNEDVSWFAEYLN